MTDYRWVLCDNKINAINDIMNELVDLNEEEYRIINLNDYEIFDLDGTLIDTLEAISKVINMTMKEMNLKNY